MSCHVIRLTPIGRAAITTLLVQGPTTTSVVRKYFRSVSGKDLDKQPLRKILYGRWQTATTSNSGAAEDVVICKTGPQEVEVHCHGGHTAQAAILESLVAEGCVPVDWRQWSEAHPDPPVRQAARTALADARTERAAQILLDQFHGALETELQAIVHELRQGNQDQATKKLNLLHQRGPLGMHLSTPWRVVVSGPPNVGKSSLINALLGYQRSIVVDIPGTTRDVVAAHTAFAGWPAELVDTAGIRAHAGPLEQAGIELAFNEVANADCLVLVFDASAAWTQLEQDLFAQQTGALLVFNKSDLISAARRHQTGRPAGLETSALRGTGISALAQQIGHQLVSTPPPAGAAVPFHASQIAAIREAQEHLARGDDERAALLLERLCHHGQRSSHQH